MRQWMGKQLRRLANWLAGAEIECPGVKKLRRQADDHARFLEAQAESELAEPTDSPFSLGHHLGQAAGLRLAAQWLRQDLGLSE
jgi:hypothetical protein